MVERWNGSNWNVQTAPAPAGATRSYLEKVSCSSTTACMAVGGYDTADQHLPLAEAWDGTAWTIEPIPVPAGTTAGELFGVSCAADNGCIAVGAAVGSAGNQALIESWDGVTWKIEDAPTPTGTTFSGLVAVSCSSIAACTAVGNYETNGGNPLVVRWNGSAWTLDSGPRVPAGTTLSAVSCIPAGPCMVAGSYSTLYPGEETDLAPVSAESW